MGNSQRKVVIVGAGSGIGAAAAAHFYSRGDHVLAVDVRPQQTPATQHVRCDLRDAGAIAKFTGGLDDGWDLLAHVAGVPGTAPAADVLTINYLGMRLMTEGMLPRLRRGCAAAAPWSRWRLRPRSAGSNASRRSTDCSTRPTPSR